MRIAIMILADAGLQQLNSVTVQLDCFVAGDATLRSKVDFEFRMLRLLLSSRLWLSFGVTRGARSRVHVAAKRAAFPNALTFLKA